MYDDKTFLSFGGGVQSTAIALMIAKHPEVFAEKGLLIPKHIIFADTGAEPDYVLHNVEKVFSILDKVGLKTYTVQAKETILDDAKKSNGRGIATPPYFTKNEYGDMGILRRQCTKTYKIEPITKKQREILGYKPRVRIPQGHSRLWLGISTDELGRAKPSLNKWMVNIFPLLELRLDRTACATYCYKELGYAVKKSACFFCPYKHQEEWVSMKRDNPELFARAVEFDERIRHLNQMGKGIRDKCFIHRSGYPLKDAAGKGIQLSLFNQEQSECSGGCFL